MKARLKNWFISQQYLNLAFVVALVLLGILTYICYIQLNNSKKKQDDIIKSLDVQIELERIFSELKGVESGYRGYMLTNDSIYYVPFAESNFKINKSIQSLQRQLGTSSIKQQQFKSLDSLIVLRFRHLREDVSLYHYTRNKQQANQSILASESALNTVHKQEGMKITEEIRRLLNVMIEQEISALKNRNSGVEKEVAPISFAFLVCFAIITLFLTFYVVRRSENRALYINTILSNNQKIFNYSERIGNTAHWYVDEKGNFSKSNNYMNLLNGVPISPFAPVESYIKSIHKKDREAFYALAKSPTKWNNLTDFIFRTATHNGRVRHFKINSQVIDINGKDSSIVGIICDITSEQRAKIALVKQNEELVKTNIELSSFNHIVSHDLQEPMRKIQMFVSRFDQAEKAKLSEKYVDILNRIQKSASRAQNLIDDLLSYTRLNREEKKPEKVDLNTLLSHAKIDLQQLIEENKAEIIAENLPSIHAIAHQIEQVFMNLISNSIKYRKKDVNPIISISSQQIKGKEIKNWIGVDPKQLYCLIEIQDNGIGFDQQYAEDIFTIFKRLHTKEEYTGTGIGLAICKKMIDKHNGHITATAELGKGATFRIYLPMQ